ncbi:hypothetical protein [Cellulophaga sp. Ld12]|uniref:hypothetical protein n=1 Tax=Cellulophaga sp. Ld12 TaxID=3229535 RepID=UPI003868ABA5
MDPGTYDVVLTVTDDLGATGFDTVEIVLEPVQEPDYTFFIDPIASPVGNSTQAVTFRISPNAAAIAQGIEFTMRYEDRSGLPNISQIEYDGLTYAVTQEFTVNSGTTSGILQGPFSQCEDIEYEFIVSTNLVLPDQTQTVGFLVRSGSVACP